MAARRPRAGKSQVSSVRANQAAPKITPQVAIPKRTEYISPLAGRIPVRMPTVVDRTFMERPLSPTAILARRILRQRECLFSDDCHIGV